MLCEEVSETGDGGAGETTELFFSVVAVAVTCLEDCFSRGIGADADADEGIVEAVGSAELTAILLLIFSGLLSAEKAKVAAHIETITISDR